MRRGFHAIAAEEPERCVLLDASGDAAAVERGVWQCVVERLDPALAETGT